MINMEIDEQQRYLDELNHKVQIKENQLGISKEKELLEQIKNNEKEIKKLKENLKDKEQIILRLKAKKKESNKEVVQVNNNDDTESLKEKITALLKEMEEIKKFSEKENKELSEENERLKKKNEALSKEKGLIEEKYKKMRNSVIELSKKFESEIKEKEKRSLYVNQTNSKLFEDIQSKNRALVAQVNKLKSVIKRMEVEKYELENIVLRQEDKLDKYKKEFSFEVGADLSRDIYSSRKSLFKRGANQLKISTSNKNHSIDGDLSLPKIN